MSAYCKATSGRVDVFISSTMDVSATEAMESHISISARTSIDSVHGAPEKVLSTATPYSPPRSSRKGSHESVNTQTRMTQSNASTPLRPLRKFPASPSTRASLDGRGPSHSGVTDLLREKTPASLLSLSDYNGSEDSHTERRFLRQYEELESRCSGTPNRSITDRRTLPGVYYAVVPPKTQLWTVQGR